MSFLKDLSDRVQMFKNWIKFGKPKVFWIGGFYIPQQLFVTTYFDFANKNSVFFEQISIDYEITDTNEAD